MDLRSTLEPIPAIAKVVKNLILDRLWTFTIILLKKHGNKIKPNDILLYPEIRASLTLTSEVSSCSVWLLEQKSTTRQCAESERHWRTQF